LHGELGLNAGVKWICSLEDIQWPEDKKNNKSLIALAVAYGVPVVSAHRALTDCELLAKIFDKVRKQGKLKDLIATASIERFTYKAILSYDERSKAKEHGFRWIADKKHWVKKMSEDEANAITFEIKKIG
jgi:DNA polymerase-3 subunit epsilon